MKHVLLPAAFLACALLASAQGRPVLALERLELRASGGDSLPDAASLTDALLALWQRQYGSVAALVPRSFAPAAAPRVQAAVAADEGGITVRLRVRGAGPEAPEAEAALRLTPGGGASLPSALAGSVFRLWAEQAGRVPAPSAPPPRPAGLLDLRALRLLEPAGGPTAEDSEPVDLGTAPGGPLLVFSRHVLRLGPRLELVPETLSGLVLPPLLDVGFLAGTAFLSSRGEARLFDPATGRLLCADEGGRALFDTGLTYPDGVAARSGGGFAVLAGGALHLFHRRGEALEELRVKLPAGLYVTPAGDGEGNAWVFDLGERRFRVFSPQGREIRSVTPQLAAGDLTFPQVCAVAPDGSFLLGDSAALACFGPGGLPRWRLEGLPAFVREALPAAYRMAWTPEADGFYLLDLPGGRLFLLLEPAALEPGSPERVFAERWPGFDPRDPAALRAALDFLSGRDLLLQAWLPARLLADPRKAALLERRVTARSAELAVGLARDLQARFFFPEAEAALGSALRLYHRLRREDPVDARWPAAIAALSAERAAWREPLFAAPLLETGLRSFALEPGAPPLKPGAPPLPPRLTLQLGVRNTGEETLNDIRLQVALAGLSAPAETPPLAALEPGGVVVLRLTLVLPAEPGGEARLCRLAFLAAYEPAGREPVRQALALSLPWPGD